jgi:hypothetical protein
MAKKKDDGETAASAGTGANGGNGGTPIGASSKGERVAIRMLLVGSTSYVGNAITVDQTLDIGRGAPPLKPPKGLSREEYKRWLIENVVIHAIARGPGGLVGVPGDNLSEALVKGGVFVKYEGNMRFTNQERSLVPSLLPLLNSFLPFPDQCQQEGTWTLDITHGWGKRGDFVVIARPRFDRWGIQPTFTFNPNEMNEAKARELIEAAGHKVGLGAHRPGKKGRYGQFEIRGWEVLKEVPVVTGQVDTAQLAKEFTWSAPTAE